MKFPRDIIGQDDAEAFMYEASQTSLPESGPYLAWIYQVASELNIQPEQVEQVFHQTRELLYNAGLNPKEAADFIHMYG